MADPAEVPGWLGEGRIPSLDGLRAVAVGLVLLAHAHQTRGFPDIPALHAIGRKGAVGVDVFFVISGFLITTLLLRERDRTGGVAIGSFYLRRTLRIVPAYACLLAAVAGLQAAGLAVLGRRDWAAALTYTVNFLRHPAWEVGHAWSLSIEEHFYLAWPFVLAVVPRLGARVALGCMVGCFAGRWAVMVVAPALTPMAELWTFTRIDTIAAGCLLAYLARDPRWRPRLDRVASRPIAVGSLLVGSLAASGQSAKFAVGIAYSLNAACIGLLVWAGIRAAGTGLGRLLNHPALATVGVASYSLYLWQQLFLNPRNPGRLCAFPVNIASALVVAFMSYHLIERPLLGLRHRLGPRAARPPAVAR